MDLDKLRELIETLKGRIATHGSTLQGSEALTRYVLIDPLLRALGWDTGDPSQVLVEYSLPKGAGKGFADYALLGENAKPLIIVEAKSLHSQLDDAAAQALTYCNMQAIAYFAVTNGQHWKLYNTFRRVPLPEKLVFELNLTGSAAKTCLNALALWRPGAVAGQIQAGTPPIVDSAEAGPLSPGVHQVNEVRTSTKSAGSMDNRRRGFHPADGYTPIPQLISVTGKKPAAIRFPDGKVKSVNTWSNLTAEIVRWLKSRGHLTEADIPVRLETSKLYFINNHMKDVGGSQYKQVDSWFVHTQYNAKSHVRNARLIIEQAGQNPHDFAVRLQ